MRYANLHVAIIVLMLPILSCSGAEQEGATEAKTGQRGPMLTDERLPEPLRGFELLNETEDSIVAKLEERGYPEPKISTTMGTNVRVRLPMGGDEPPEVNSLSFHFDTERNVFSGMIYETPQSGECAELEKLYADDPQAAVCANETLAEKQTAKEKRTIWCLAVKDGDRTIEVEVSCEPGMGAGNKVRVEIPLTELYEQV